jgi:hypothetical protein
MASDYSALRRLCEHDLRVTLEAYDAMAKMLGPMEHMEPLLVVARATPALLDELEAALAEVAALRKRIADLEVHASRGAAIEAGTSRFRR